MTTLSALRLLADFINEVWFWSYMLSMLIALYERRKPNERLRNAWIKLARVHQELWPFAWVEIIVTSVEANMNYPGSGLLGIISAVVWWFSRKWPDDDDRWKKRMKRAKEKVSVLGGKLIIVPAN